MSVNYRKIYEDHHGSIPKDSDGRSYDIHHIDGDHSNNDSSNLKAVTIQEHFNIHYARHNWAACLRIGSRLKLSVVELSELSKQTQRKRIKEGTHHLLRRPDGTSHATDRVSAGIHQFQTRPNGTSVGSDQVVAGTHNLLGGDIQRETNIRRVKNGSHNFLSDNNPNKNMPKITCPQCGKIGGRNAMKRWHFDNCRIKNDFA